MATELALRALGGELPMRRIVPEGLDDISVELDTGWLHLQAKSRREHRGEFPLSQLSDVWPALAERLAVDTRARAGLVLERPLLGVETGLGRTLVQTAPKALRNAIIKAINGGPIAPEEFLRRTHIVVTQATPATAVDLLGALTEAPPSTRLAYREILRGRLGGLADENGEPGRSPANAASMSRSDLAKVLEDAAEAFDPSALDEAVGTGLCEIADFATPRQDGRFYAGVDVTLGHVVAGLPAERPIEIGALEAGLAERQAAIVVGPSGAGKSALIWMTAYAKRHDVRWYRVKRLETQDAAIIARLAKGLEPAVAGPVGFVVDDLGSADRAGFDALAAELRERPGTFLLAACREEDLVLVRTAHTAAQVRPQLDEPLAERLWLELHETAETAWPEWREPFEASAGLLLEYGHLLTRGTRLAETVREQVTRRIRDRRDTELDVLAPAALASAFGAHLKVDRLTGALDYDPADVRAALTRLVDEHLVTERDGLLGGLHELRSLAIAQAIHRVPPPTLEQTVRNVITLLAASELRPFLTRLLLSNLVPEDIVVDAVVDRVVCDHDPVALAGALHALRIAAIRTAARDWRVILDEEGVPPTSVGIVTHFATYGFRDTDDLFPEPLRRAATRIRSLSPRDPRADVAGRLGAHLRETIAATRDVAQAADVLAALAEAGPGIDVDPVSLAALARGAPLPDVRALLEAVGELSRELAEAIVAELGGEEALLERVQRELPWARGACLDREDDRPVARADYAYVADQPDPHARVVDLTRYLHAFAPSAEVAVSRALDARGAVAGYRDHPIADKAIPRENNPSRVVVAWNRARGRAAYAAVAGATETEYTIAARDLVKHALALVRRTADLYARGKKPSARLIEEASALSSGAQALRPPPQPVDATGPLEDGHLAWADPAANAASTIATNLCVRLFTDTDGRVAPVIPQIIKDLDQLADPQRWRLLSDSPLADIRELRRALVDVHDIAAEIESDTDAAIHAIRLAAKSGFSSAAAVARRRAETRIAALAAAIEEATPGAAVARLPGEPDSPWWPPDVFAILVEVSSLLTWDPEPIADRCRTVLADRPPFMVAPVRDGRVVAAGTFVVFPESILPTDALREANGLPLPLLEERLSACTRTALDGLTTVSAIVANLPPNVHDEEHEALADAWRRAQEAHDEICNAADNTSNEIVAGIAAALEGLRTRVQQEAEARNTGAPIPHPLAHSVLDGLDGMPDDVFHEYLGIILLALEFDVGPEQAIDRLNEILPPGGHAA